MDKDYRPINEHLDNLIDSAVRKLENRYDPSQENTIEVSQAEDLLLEAIVALSEKVSCLQEQLEDLQQQHGG